MNTPYMKARLADVFQANDADGQLVLVARFDGHASDGAKWREIDKMPNTSRLPETDPLGVRGTTWKLWCLPARAATAKGGA